MKALLIEEDLDEIWRASWWPPDRSPPWEWAQRHVETIPYSPLPGRFRIENSLQIREPLCAIVDPCVRTVCLLAAVQSAKTMAAELALAYIVANLPGPTLWLDATDEEAKDHSESRIQKLFDQCEPVRRLYPSNRHQKRNTTILFANGMTLWMLGAHNRTNLQRRSIRWVIGDECWQYPQGNMAEAEARVTAFGWLGKCVWMSQGGLANDDFHRKFETTDQREWTFACPACGFRQPYRWSNIEWSSDAKGDGGDYDFRRVRETTSIRCEACAEHFADSDEMRRRLNATGAFVATNQNAARENVGFHWNAIATMSWGALAEMYLRAKRAARSGDISLLQQFHQKRLAQPWQDYIEDVELEIEGAGYKRGELWDREAGINSQNNIVPAGLAGTAGVYPLRFITVDVQQDCFYAIVRSWAEDGSSRLIWNAKLVSFDEIEELQERFGVYARFVFMDAGYASSNIYFECSKRNWTAMMGDARTSFVHRQKGRPPIQRFYSPRRKIVLSKKLACSAFFFATLPIKDTLARLKRNRDPERGPTWEVPEDVDEDYLAQLQSEHRVQDRGKWLWKRIGKRDNHYLDCECMQVAAAYMVKLIGRESVPGPEESQGEREAVADDE